MVDSADVHPAMQPGCALGHLGEPKAPEDLGSFGGVNGI
jgi:hypothetical protein